MYDNDLICGYITGITSACRQKKHHVKFSAIHWNFMKTILYTILLEKLVHKKVVFALESHGLLSDFNLDFVAGDLLWVYFQRLYMIGLLLLSNRKLFTLFLDLAKAFDSVPHYHLLLRLDLLGIRGDLLSWFRAFLTCRRQRVVINGQTSSWLDVYSGVPQGSVLGPLLFILYIDGLHHSVTNSTLKIFVDDVTLYKVVADASDCHALQEDLTCIFGWTVAWQV